MLLYLCLLANMPFKQAAISSSLYTTFPSSRSFSIRHSVQTALSFGHLLSIFAVSVPFVHRYVPANLCSAMRPDACRRPLIGDMHKNFVIVLTLPFVTRTFGAKTSPDNYKDVPACIEDQRTVLSIVWSCLATIFACTWLAVHPNVPWRKITTKGAISCAIEQVKIMAITILAPEVIIGWAAEQFIMAWKLRHSEYFISSGVIPFTKELNRKV